MEDEARFTLGGNLPPLTPFELSAKEAEDLLSEACNWVDGMTVESQEQADALDGLLAKIKAAAKLAEERRKAEVKPFDEAKAEIQSRYNTLIGDTKATGKGKLLIAQEAVLKLLTPWRQKIDEEKRAAAEALRKAEEEKRQAAMAAFAKAREANDLAAKLEAERLAAEAAAAEKAAKKADKAVGQKTGLRVVVTAEITDMSAFAKWAWTHDKAALEEHFAARANDLAKNGRRDLPGVVVHENKEARK